MTSGENILMARVYGYGRHSTDRQGLTEEAQRTKVEAYIRQHLPDHPYAGWLYDSAVSGARPLFGREQGSQLDLLLEEGDHIVWARLDRAFRSVIDGASTLAELGRRGVFVHSLDLGLDTSTAVGRCVCTVMLAFAELEREYTVARTRDALRVKKRAGLPYGRFTPIGWKRYGTGRASRFIPDPDERQQAGHIAALRASGLSYDSIVSHLRGTLRPCGREWNRNTARHAVRAHGSGFPKLQTDGAHGTP
jgi:DNA invertase Pin-like site-specific DNA recombinase